MPSESDRSFTSHSSFNSRYDSQESDSDSASLSPETILSDKIQKLKSDSQHINNIGFPRKKPNVQPFIHTEWFVPVHKEVMRQLISLNHTKVIVDIGSYYGASTIYLARKAQNAIVFAVDIWDEDKLLTEHGEEYGVEATRELFNLYPYYETFLVNTWDFKEAIIPMKMTSKEALDLLKKYEIVPDLIYVDGDNRYEVVKQDITSCLNYFPSAHIVGDDYGIHKSVRAAVRDCADTYLKTTFITCNHVWSYSNLLRLDGLRRFPKVIENVPLQELFHNTSKSVMKYDDNNDEIREDKDVIDSASKISTSSYITSFSYDNANRRSKKTFFRHRGKFKKNYDTLIWEKKILIDPLERLNCLLADTRNEESDESEEEGGNSLIEEEGKGENLHVENTESRGKERFKRKRKNREERLLKKLQKRNEEIEDEENNATTVTDLPKNKNRKLRRAEQFGHDLEQENKEKENTKRKIDNLERGGKGIEKSQQKFDAPRKQGLLNIATMEVNESVFQEKAEMQKKDEENKASIPPARKRLRLGTRRNKGSSTVEDVAVSASVTSATNLNDSSTNAMEIHVDHNKPINLSSATGLGESLVNHQIYKHETQKTKAKDEEEEDDDEEEGEISDEESVEEVTTELFDHRGSARQHPPSAPIFDQTSTYSNAALSHHQSSIPQQSTGLHYFPPSMSSANSLPNYSQMSQNQTISQMHAHSSFPYPPIAGQVQPPPSIYQTNLQLPHHPDYQQPINHNQQHYNYPHQREAYPNRKKNNYPR